MDCENQPFVTQSVKEGKIMKMKIEIEKEIAVRGGRVWVNRRDQEQGRYWEKDVVRESDWGSEVGSGEWVRDRGSPEEWEDELSWLRRRRRPCTDWKLDNTKLNDRPKMSIFFLGVRSCWDVEKLLVAAGTQCKTAQQYISTESGILGSLGAESTILSGNQVHNQESQMIASHNLHSQPYSYWRMAWRNN